MWRKIRYIISRFSYPMKKWEGCHQTSQFLQRAAYCLTVFLADACSRRHVGLSQLFASFLEQLVENLMVGAALLDTF